MRKIPDKHVFVCINCRDSSRKSCGNKGLEIRTKLLALLVSSDQKDNIRINKSGCLDLCENGPAMVVYPNNIWYKEVSLDDCEEIYNKTILKDEIIDRLLLDDKDIDN